MRRKTTKRLASNRTQTLRYWLIAFRPKTLTLALVPVLTGSMLGWIEGGALDGLAMGAAMLAAVLIQIGTNLHNDAADFERGADQAATRLGPPRATTQGWLSADQVRRGAALSFALALMVGIYLVSVGGWPILVAGLLSIAAGVAYTGGPRPIAYTGLGELFVCLFFGVVALMGSYYLQTNRLSWTALVLGLSVGMLAAAVLVVNNYRDLDNDKQVGKNTLAVRLDRPATQVEYALLVFVPFLLLPLLPLLGLGGQGWLLPLAVLPWALRLINRFRREAPGPAFNQLLAATARLQLAFGVLISLGLGISHG